METRCKVGPSNEFQQILFMSRVVLYLYVVVRDLLFSCAPVVRHPVNCSTFSLLRNVAVQFDRQWIHCGDIRDLDNINMICNISPVTVAVNYIRSAYASMLYVM